jgi:Fe-S-cluster containining protein
VDQGINCLTDCPSIGACCKVFYVSGPSNKDELVQRIAEDTPFTVLEEMEDLPQLVVTCGNLCLDGLCQDYANRPELCRSFQPGT